MDLDVGTLVDGRYRVQGRLGEGGMAVVYQVVHEQLGTPHALKVLSLTQRSVRERMLQEGRLQARLRHPNIVAVTDVIVVDRSPGLVMELVDGMPLDDLIRMQRLTLEQVDIIGRGILAAVAHAHALELIHRDLKPANVLLEIVDQTVKPKLTDFGLAKVLRGGDEEGKPATRTGSTMGTPQYMSPEQIRDSKNVDARGDLFAVAAILYEMLTGERAFDGENVLDIFQAVDRGAYVPVRELRPDAPACMVAAIEAGLVGDREQRIASAEALYALWTDGEELDQAPPPATLGTLPSYEEVKEATATQVQEAPSSPSLLSTAAPVVMVGGGVMALAAAGGVILVLVGVIVYLWSRPPETVEVPGQRVEVPVPVAAPVPVEVVEPAEPSTSKPEEPAPAEPAAGMGRPWNEAVGPDGEVLQEPPEPVSEPAPRVTEDPPERAPGRQTRGERLARAYIEGNLASRTAILEDLVDQWRYGSGPLPSTELVLQVMEVSPGLVRKVLVSAYAVRGTSLQVPVTVIRGRAADREAVNALVTIARRQGTEAEARAILLENQELIRERLLTSALQDLGGR